MHSLCMSGGRLLVIGGAESHDEHDDAILSRFVELAGEGARVIVIATASARADRLEKEYLAVFERLGAGEVRPLRLETRDQADSDEAVATVRGPAIRAGACCWILAVSTSCSTTRTIRRPSPR
jgi:cyanophycinase-like exopeptidase